MIKVTRLGSKSVELAVNAELIEMVESTPDTVITLTSGDKLIVQESLDEVIERVVAYKRLIHQRGPGRTGSSKPRPEKPEKPEMPAE